jgi:3-oxoacyl-[acyl-carrier protein] reductase
VERALETLGERWQSLNILVNAARPVDVGIGVFEDVDDEEWQATFDIGTVSAARCVRAALPLLRSASWARIVNISAHSTKRQSASIVAYTAAKAALTSLSKNLSGSGCRRDLGEHGLAWLLPVRGSEGLLTWSPPGAPR